MNFRHKKTLKAFSKASENSFSFLTSSNIMKSFCRSTILLLLLLLAIAPHKNFATQ